MDQQLNAALIIKSFCPSGRVGWMFGPDNATKRQHLMGQLLGRNVPKSQAGVTVLEKTCKELLGMQPCRHPREGGQYYGCPAVEEKFMGWLLAGL